MTRLLAAALLLAPGCVPDFEERKFADDPTDDFDGDGYSDFFSGPYWYYGEAL